MQTFTKRFSFVLVMMAFFTASITAQDATLQRANSSNQIAVPSARISTNNSQQRVDVLPISTFSDGADWVASAAVMGDTSLWQVTTNPAVTGSFTASTVASPTVADGFGLINFDLYANGNTATAPVTNYLTSPSYDVSSLDSGNVYQMTFYSLQRYCCTYQTGNAARVSFSIDGGATFSEPQIAQKFLGANDAFEDTESVRLPAGVDTATQFQVRFVYAGAYYFWAVDDLEISVLPNVDIELRDNFYSIAPYTRIPSAQLNDSIRFLVDVLNNGASNDTFDIIGSVYTFDGGVIGDLIYVDSLRYSGVAYDSLAENQIFSNTFPLPTEEGVYLLQYEVSNFDATEVDANLDNNTIDAPFVVSSSTYSKTLGNTNGGRRSVDDDDGELGYEIGNFYYMPDPTNWQIDSVTIQAYNRGFDAASLENIELEVYVYGFTGDLDGDGESTGDDEMEEIDGGFFAYDASLLDGAGDNTDLTIVFDDPIELTDDYPAYGVSFLYFPPPNTTGNIFVGVGADYGAASLANPDTTYQHHFYRETFASDDYNYVGIDGLAPNIVVHMTDKDASSTKDAELPTSAFSVRPNPATTQFSIDFDFGTTVNAQFEIVNAVGQTVSAFNRDGLSTGAITIPTQGMNNGLYYIKVRTADGQTASRKLLLNR